MTNEEHVKIVKRGAKAIAAWRKARPGEYFDLAEADLIGADLRETNLRRAVLRVADLRVADLRGADLRTADLRVADLRTAVLRKADLRGADLGRANLSEADLSGAALSGADLRGADLSGANLSEADLSGANLSGANLSEANLRRSFFLQTVVGDADLSHVIGLESVNHRGPSTIGVDTLLKSGGKIPDEFLRGCGLADWEILASKLYDPGLSSSQINDLQYKIFDHRTGSPIQISPVFISYTHADGAFVDAIEKDLNQAGVRFWRDIHHATAGKIDKIIDRAMRLNPTVLLVLSKDSVESRWVEDEVDRAVELEKETQRDVLCPIALDDAWKTCGWSRPLRTQIKKFHVLPFGDWRDSAARARQFRKLVDGLKGFYAPLPAK